jgi:hypothetical protein
LTFRCSNDPATRADSPPFEETDMGDGSLIRAALLIALITAFGLAATGRAPAADFAAIGQPAASMAQ